MSYPPKFTEETCEKLLVAIRKGAPYSIACNYAGISLEAFRKWRNKAKKGDAEMEAFFHKVREAEGHTALVWMDRIDQAMAENWQAAAWKLERRYFSEFSSNPLVREEIKNLAKKITLIQKLKQKEQENGTAAKAVDKERSETPRCITQGIEGPFGREDTSEKDGESSTVQ